MELQIIHHDIKANLVGHSNWKNLKQQNLNAANEKHNLFGQFEHIMGRRLIKQIDKWTASADLRIVQSNIL